MKLCLPRLFAVLALAITPWANAQHAGENLLPNGGFEDGINGWGYQKWDGKSIPGELNRTTPYEGLMSFRMGTEDEQGRRYLTSSARPIDPDRNYLVSIMLKAENQPKGDIAIRLLQWGTEKGEKVQPQGWIAPRGMSELIRIGGTFDWREFQYFVRSDLIKPSTRHLLLFIDDKHIGQGTLGVDNVSVRQWNGEPPERSTKVTRMDEGVPPKEPAKESASEKAPRKPPRPAAPSGNLFDNGGFEDGTENWSWQGDEPGYLDNTKPFDGNQCYVLHDADADGAGAIRMAMDSPIDTSSDYVLSLAMRGENIESKQVEVNLLQFSDPDKPGKKVLGWVSVPAGSGVNRLIAPQGTFGWKIFEKKIPADAIDDRTHTLNLYVRNHALDSALVAVDNVRLARADAEQPADLKPAVTYMTGDPCVVKKTPSSLAIRVEPERDLYRAGEVPAVSVAATVARPDATLRWTLLNGKKETLKQKTGIPFDAKHTVDVPLPAGHGYYEVVAEALVDDRVVDQVRRSLGVLTSPAPTEGEEPFGLWVQGSGLYPELGVRWIRTAFYPDLMRQRGEDYVRERREQLQFYHDNDIRVLAYPKGIPRRIRGVSKKIIQDKPEAWDILEQEWTRMVKAFKDDVDMWGVINEPYRGMWKGNNELITRYWSLMRRIVDRHDPGKPLIGPSLNTNKPHMQRQYRELLEAGFGKLVDGIEIHTYTSHRMPEDEHWNRSTALTRKMTREALGSTLPLYSTEMGMSAEYDQEFFHAAYTARCFLWAKKLDYKMIMWHMFSWPQGGRKYQRNFALFRNSKQGNGIPVQARPAGVSFGVLTRQLAGASYTTELDYLGPTIKAFVFERNRDRAPMLALWSLSKQPRAVRIAVNVPETTVTDVFGRKRTLATENGILNVTAEMAPVYIAPVAPHLLETRPLVETEGAVRVLPGADRDTVVPFTIANPMPNPATLRIEPAVSDDWSMTFSRAQWRLESGASADANVRVRAAAAVEPGNKQLFLKVYADGKYVRAASLPVEVQAPLELVDVTPALQRGEPAFSGVLKRNDPRLDKTQVSLPEGDAEVTVALGGAQTEFVLPAPALQPDVLQKVTVRASAPGIRHPAQQSLDASFIGAERVEANASRRIDGRLDDWRSFSSEQAAADFAVLWAWEPEALYLAVRVRDDKHVLNTGSDTMWRQDSIQLGLAPNKTGQLLREPISEMWESYFKELNLGLMDGDEVLHCSRTMNRETGDMGTVPPGAVERAVRRAGSTTLYEMRLPARYLGFKPFELGDVLRAAVLINRTDDGETREVWEWFKGIMSAKSPDLFGHVILTE